MFTSINPATGQPGQRFAELTDAQVDARLAKAHETFLAWRENGLDDRMTLLRHIAERFEDDKDRLARIATEEMGKTLKSAIAEVEKCASAFRYYARHGAQLAVPMQEIRNGSFCARCRVGRTCRARMAPIGATRDWRAMVIGSTPRRAAEASPPPRNPSRPGRPASASLHSRKAAVARMKIAPHRMIGRM